MRRPPILPSLLPLCAALLLATAAGADPRTGFLIEQLKTNDDYRVRTQAALALGASADDAAVSPLCDALGADSNVSVKVAAAAALGKLAKPAAIPCLKDREAKETTSAVKSQIQKSLSALQGASGGGDALAVGPDTKYYVAIQVTNKTKRAASDVENLVRGAMQSRFASKRGYALAPRGEAPDKGGQVIRARNLKGFFLLATVEAPLYEGGNLTQVVRVSMFTYPGKALQGEIAPRLTQTGTPAGDTESETLLIKMCIENAVDSFQKVAASL